MQASQAAAVTEGEALRLRFRQAQASLPQLTAELQTTEALLQSRLRECQGWMARHDHIVHALRDELPPQLMLPEQYWILDQAPTPIGTLARVYAHMNDHDDSLGALKGFCGRSQTVSTSTACCSLYQAGQHAWAQ